MESILSFINEKLELNKQSRIMTPDEAKEATKVTKNSKWVAIEITTEDSMNSNKQITNQRVVTTDTYADLKSNGYTKGHARIISITKLSPVCSSKDDAFSYLDHNHRSRRKTKIDPKGSDYVVWCISSGKMNPSGNTYWNFNFWDEWKDAEIYIDRYGTSFLMGAPGSLKVGDTVFCVDNETEKKYSGAPDKIEAISKCNIDDFRKEYRKALPRMCKPARRMFGKDIDGLPWGRMGQFYSIKGITLSSDL